MGWASKHIVELMNGKTVQFRPVGGSMKGKIESGQLCTVEPIKEEPKIGDVVLVVVRGQQYLHFVKDIEDKAEGTSYQIGNNRGGFNGWVHLGAIFGKLIKVEP